MLKLFKQVNKPRRATESYCQSLTFLKLLGEWAFLSGVTDDSQYHPEVGEPATHAGVGNFVELLNFAVRQGNEDLEDHLKNCSSRETYISKTTQNNLLNCCYDLFYDIGHHKQS